MDIENKIYHGAAYYPEVWDKETIKQDIAYMKQLGINVVRIAEFAWALLETDEDVFNIGLFDEVIEELGKNDIKVIMCTPTACPPRWLTKKYPESLILDRWMNRAHHGSREHVCFNNPDYINRSKIIVTKLAEHYGKNPNIIAWQLHNEYNCPPVSECVCDACQNEYRTWLKNKYKTIENLNHEWCSGVWSTRYNSFEDIIAPRPTPNGHSASMSTNYTLFTFDSVSKFNQMAADIIHKYSSVPVTHNTNKCFHINQKDIFAPLDFASFDTYMPQANYVEYMFDVELTRNLKAGVPFMTMETSNSSSANLHGAQPMHKRGYVKAEAVNQFFAGSHGFSYWLFRQHRGGTEMPHGHLVNAFGTLSSCSANVLDVTNEIKKLTPFLIGTKPKKAEIAMLFSDEARAFVMNETLNGNNYMNDLMTTYGLLLKNSYYRDIIYPHNDFSGYKVIIIPFVAHLNDEMISKIEDAANNGATVIVGPYSGWRTSSHGYYTDNCFGPIEKLFGQKVIDCEHMKGLDATYEAFGITSSIDRYSAFVDNGIGVVHGDYFEGKSLICENNLGKGKIVFVGTFFQTDMQEKLLLHYINDNVEKKVNADEGIIVYEREDSHNDYICLVNLSRENKRYSLNNDYKDNFTSEEIHEGILPSNEFVILKKQ